MSCVRRWGSELKPRLDLSAEQPAPAPHLARPEGRAAPRIVLVTVPRVRIRGGEVLQRSDPFNREN